MGTAFWSRVGTVIDDVRARILDAALLRYPGRAPGDALDEIGRDRLLPRAPAETDADYAARLGAAWDTWGGNAAGGGAGTPYALLQALLLLGLPTGATGATVVQQDGRYHQLDGAGGLVVGDLMSCVNRVALDGTRPNLPGWTFEGRDTFYSEFGLLFPADVPALTVGSVLADAINYAVVKWTPAKMLYVGTWVIATGRTLGWPPTGRTLATEPVLGGNVVRYLVPAGGNQIGYVP